MDRRNGQLKYFTPVILLYAILVGGGFIKVFIESLGYIPAFQMNTLSLSSYITLFNSSNLTRDFFYSVYIAVTATSLSLTVSVLLAFKIVRSKNPFIQKIVTHLFEIGMVLPYLYMVLVISLLFGRTGVISRWMFHFGVIDSLEGFPNLIYNTFGLGMILTYVFKGIPFVTLFLINYMSNISLSYDQVAKTLGATDLELLRKIYLPLSKNTIVWSGMILVAYDYGAFEVPYLLGSNKPRTLAIDLYNSYTKPGIDHIPETMAIAVLLFITGVLLVLIYARFVSVAIYIITTFNLSKQKVYTISKSSRITKTFNTILFVIFPILLLISYAYIVLLSFNSFFRYPLTIPRNFSLNYWKNLFLMNPLFIKASIQSLLIGGLTGIFATILGFLTGAGIIKYYENHIHQALLIISLPLFIPGMSLFLGAHQILIRSPIANSLLGVVIVHTIISLPYTTSIGITYIKGFPPKLNQLGATLGANKRIRLTKIMFPIVKPGLILAMSISFLISNTEYFSTFLIGGSKTVTLSMVMYPYIANVDINMAAVTGITFILGHLLMFLLIKSLLKQKVSVKALYNME